MTEGWDCNTVTHIPPPRDAVALCGAQYADRRRGGPHRGSPHQRGIRQLSADGRRDTAPTARDAHHRGQSLGPQDAAGPDLLGDASAGVHLHYTPTYSSWLNQVELWFSKIERDVIARGIFTSVTDLRRKLMRYIKHYNKIATPIRWSYADPSRRIA